MTGSNFFNVVVALGLVASAGLTTACDGTPVSADPRGETLALEASGQTMERTEENVGLATLRKATARYHRVDAAIEDGFQRIPNLGCVDPPGPGAVGIPFLNIDRLDATIDLAEPEVLFYERQRNGKLRLVGAEPVVPIAMWDAAESEPPSMFGREFHRNDAHGLYGLHMWVWQQNPAGTFAFANPGVSCEFAE